MRQHQERITVTIERVQGGFFVDSEDMPELNVFVAKEERLTMAVPEAIKYLYRHNHHKDVRVLMEVPIFASQGGSQKPRRTVEIEYRDAA